MTDDLGADSIDLMELVMRFETDVLDEGIPTEEIQGLTTVGQIVDYLQSRLAADE